MARENTRTLALIGSGWQAGAQVEAITMVRNIEKIKVYSMSYETAYYSAIKSDRIYLQKRSL